MPDKGACTVFLAVAGRLMWMKLDGNEEWMPVAADRAEGIGIVLSPGDVTVGAWQLTRRVAIHMEPAIHTVENGPDIRLEPCLAPLSRQVSYFSQDESIACVDAAGLVHVGSPGTTRVRVEADGVCSWCDIQVQPACTQLIRPGRKLFDDRFDGYRAGTDAFLEQMSDHGYVLGKDAGKHTRRSYDIAEGERGKFLLLRSGMSTPAVFSVDKPFDGDITLQFDFYFTHPRTGTSSILTLPGQMLRVDLFADSQVCGVVQLTPEGVRIEHKPNGLRDSVTAPEKFCWDVIYPLNCWHTAKLVRIHGGICVKIWPADQPEPERWSYVLMSPELVADGPTRISLCYEVQMSPGQQLAIDRLSICGGEA